MEAILETVIVVFMLFLCALCLFAVLVIVRDIITESTRRRRKHEEEDSAANQTPAPTPVPAESAPTPVVLVQAPAPAPAEPAAPVVVVQAPTPAPVEPEPVVEEPAPEAEEVALPEAEVEEVVAEPAEDDPNAVKFSTSHVMTLAEKYAALSSEYKGYFDEICKHAAAKEGAKEFRNNSYCDYKQGAQRLVRLTIKRGEIVCQFTFIDRDFKNYASQNNVKMKSSATTLKVLEPAAVGVVKDGIDLVCQQIAEEKEFKKQQARERRRAKRAAEKGEVTNA